MVFAGIVAGGSGLRMGADRPKQFLDIKGRPILIHTVQRFLSVKQIDRVYIAVHPDWMSEAKKQLSAYIQDDDLRRITVLKGGSDRNASVFNIISEIRSNCDITDNDILLTHDAVRPFVSVDTINENIISAEKHAACTTAVPATDTILYSENGLTVDDTPDRSKLLQAQTPQSFKINTLLSAYSELTDWQRSRLTDVCGIFSAAGMPVHIVYGSPENIKITTPFDMKLAELLL